MKTGKKSGIKLERCRSCETVWSLPRGFCPHCGGDAVDHIEAAGTGTLFACTLVHRAPSEAFKPYLPYRLALVDLDEGPRLMAHLVGDLPIGTRVAGAMEMVAGSQIPVFKAVIEPMLPEPKRNDAQ